MAAHKRLEAALAVKLDPARPAIDASDRASLKKRYGISYDEFCRLLALQGGGCAICGAGPSNTRTWRLSVDHCHSTRKVRGLLCTRCNTALGSFKDDVALLRAAIAYLERNK